MSVRVKRVLGSLLSSLIICLTSGVSIPVSADNIQDSIDVTEVKNDAETEFFKVSSEDSRFFESKVDGYWCTVRFIKDDKKWVIPMQDNEEPVEVGSFNDAISFEFFDAGEELPLFRYQNSNTQNYLVFSEDAVSISKCWLVKSEEAPVGVDKFERPELHLSLPATNDNRVTMHITGTSGSSLARDIFLEKYDSEDERWHILYQDWGTEVYEHTDLDFEYVIGDNGKYRIYVENIESSWTSIEFDINSIKKIDEIDSSLTDTKKPTITVKTEDKSGLTVGMSNFAITAYTDEPCSISIGSISARNVTELVGYAYYNGEYTITATDNSGNMSTKTVLVTAFGDGSMPNEAALSQDETVNDNPVNLSNMENFWEDVASGNIKLGEDEDDEHASTLPQTGRKIQVMWCEWILLGVLVILVIVLWRVEVCRKLKRREHK